MAVKLSVLSSEAIKETQDLLDLHTSIIDVLIVIGSFQLVRWPLGARGGMETPVGGRTILRNCTADAERRYGSFLVPFKSSDCALILLITGLGVGCSINWL